MKKPPPDDVLEHFYYEAIRDVAELSEDIAHYDRLDEGSGGDRSYQWLYQVVERRVRQKRTRQNMLEMQESLGSLEPIDPFRPWNVQVHAAPARRGSEKGGQAKSEPALDSSNADKVCFAFNQPGGCRFGDKCRYLHR